MVEDGGVCRVISAKALVRLDKRKDRVEISSHQLMSGATEAERLAVELRRTVRVVGWYHSHPHITVWPSAVVLVSNITQQLGLLTMPLLQMMENRLERNQRQLRRLLAERDSLAERLGSAAVKREPSKADVDSGAETDLRLSDDETGGAAHSPSSEDTVYLQSAAERELGVSSTRRPLKVESDSDSDSTVSLELARSRRQPRVKRERDSDTEELPTESEGGRLRRRLTVVKEEPDL
ncbi:Lys-63-specific deubiquitinase BRCC36 [Amphibalanus amphitrite]|uniref:Lys-63-specific deubiquitinase BRCC36 n=1 Tax=Amphibalanus amphitrite TaxID=1232801 RepID=A0A6A4X227_AMPAM|nr:Lys-63-specific deubiquitinase BRCC36 [Amphibalanus amphitrite]